MTSASDRSRDGPIAAKPPEPVIDKRGVPQCTEDCGRYDGKRCELLGYRPSSLCEPAVRQMAEALESERTLRRELERQLADLDEHHQRHHRAQERFDALQSVAIQIMRHCNERPECPFCGIDDGEHEPGELCSMLDDTLNPPSPSGPGGGKEP